jgi:hypothetical protein
MRFRNYMYGLLRAASIPVCGTLRYAASMVVVCGAWWYDARYLNRAFDANLSLIKSTGQFLDDSGRVEAAMRAFSAEKMLLFAEVSAVVWLAGKATLWLLGKIFRRRPGDEAKAVAVGP